MSSRHAGSAAAFRQTRWTTSRPKRPGLIAVLGAPSHFCYLRPASHGWQAEVHAQVGHFSQVAPDVLFLPVYGESITTTGAHSRLRWYGPGHATRDAGQHLAGNAFERTVRTQAPRRSSHGLVDISDTIEAKLAAFA